MARQYDSLYKNLYGIGAALVCFLLLLPTLRLMPTDAQLPPTTDISREQGLDAKILDFFMSLKRGNHTLALEELLRQSALGSASAESQLTDLRKEVEKAGTLFGDIQSWEKSEGKPIGSDIILVRYILKYDRYPVMWTFLFYRKPSSAPSITSPGSSWELIELYFDTNFSERH
jgi:hypothetical protein